MDPRERKVVLVTRRTRLQDLVVAHHTLAQARFYVEHLGADFSDYVREDAAYRDSVRVAQATLQAWGRHQAIDRDFLPNFVFGDDDIVVALGQDGLVANTMKYLHGHPLIGVNPEPTRWDGTLLPFRPADLDAVVVDVTGGRRATQSVTMAEARLGDGQVLRAVNDLFIGPRTHTSALYEIESGGRREAQSSSGIIVATGLGSTAWLRSVVTGSLGIAQALRTGASDSLPDTLPNPPYRREPWDSRRLTFAVREPFPSQASGTALLYGTVGADAPLKIRSRMPTQGVIFSDGIEADFLRFTAGMEATIGLSPVEGRLVV